MRIREILFAEYDAEAARECCLKSVERGIFHSAGLLQGLECKSVAQFLQIERMRSCCSAADRAIELRRAAKFSLALSAFPMVSILHMEWAGGSRRLRLHPGTNLGSR